jgi:Uma2 family endonuclease
LSVPLTETASAVRTWFIDRVGVYPAGDTLVCYRMNDNTVSVAPGLFAVLGAAGNRPRGSWIVWREGKVPSLVVEIASESTWRWDADEKTGHLRRNGRCRILTVLSHGPGGTPTMVRERLVGDEY